jgi:hypothetical protein
MLNIVVYTVVVQLSLMLITSPEAAAAADSNQRAEKCIVTARSYSAVDPCPGLVYGFVDLNGQRVWEGMWCNTNIPNNRGITIITLDPITCNFTSLTTFDMWADSASGNKLAAHLRQIDDLAVVVGVSGDEPTQHLGESRRLLASFGVDISDIGYRGNFEFILQKRFPKKTLLVKSRVSVSPSSTLTAIVRGPPGENVEFIRLED